MPLLRTTRHDINPDVHWRVCCAVEVKLAKLENWLRLHGPRMLRMMSLSWRCQVEARLNLEEGEDAAAALKLAEDVYGPFSGQVRTSDA